MELRVLLAALVVVFILYFFLRPEAGLRLPPGPKGKPIIGNLLDLPAAGKQEWQHWLKHKELYGIENFFDMSVDTGNHFLTAARAFEFDFDIWDHPGDHQRSQTGC